MANSSNLAFCLEYSNHKTDMMDAFDDYLRSESMVDVMLSCEGNTIKAHKMVLSAGSTYFLNIFSAFKNPFQFPVLIIKDMPFRDLKAIVEFLYRGEVVVPVEQVSSLSKSAQTLFIKGLEKYFNKSAMVNVGNQSTSANTSSANVNTNGNNSTQNVVKTPKALQKDTKRSISMSLRQNRRPNYRQLSNGDFNSDESNTDEEQDVNPRLNQIRIGKGSTQVTVGRKHQNQLSRPIKSEMAYFEDYRSEGPEQREPADMPHLEVAVNSEDDMNNDDNEDQDVYRSESQSNRYYMEGEGEQASTSKCNSDEELHTGHTRPMEPRGLIRNPIRITPRRVKTPFMGRHRKRKGTNKRADTQSPNLRAIDTTGSTSTTTSTGNVILGPIKADPDKVQIIHCSLCPRVFSQTSSLNIHMKRIHADEHKEHICQLCGKKYSWRSGLYKHMRTHRN